jgi:hypothetical protein
MPKRTPMVLPNTPPAGQHSGVHPHLLMGGINMERREWREHLTEARRSGYGPGIVHPVVIRRARLTPNLLESGWRS